MSAFSAFRATFRYEFLMQIRRPALWITFLGFALLSLRAMVSFTQDPQTLEVEKHLTILQQAASLTLISNWLAPLGIGIFLADRLVRDRRIRVEEMLGTLPTSLRVRLWGKYFGALAASIIPGFLIYVILIALIVSQTQNYLFIPICLLCYIVIVLPGTLFIAAFSLACPSLMWVPLYQFLFFGYWFWGNIFSPSYGLPTLSGTVVTPIGSMISAGIFGVSPFGWIQDATPLAGYTSLFLMLAIALLVIVALHGWLKFEQTRQ